ncbi:50S ribosomal protein L29 [Buchnera aphidicola]|uniref:50S ribosomal protein L29 n=1 Tax=Buchnera aphidicola TaxID=9 RepID=UPI003464C53A
MSLLQLRKKSFKDLKMELLSLLREQFNLKMQRSTGKFKQFHLFRKVRKNIARIKTLMTQKG